MPNANGRFCSLVSISSEMEHHINNPGDPIGKKLTNQIIDIHSDAIERDANAIFRIVVTNPKPLPESPPPDTLPLC